MNPYKYVKKHQEIGKKAKLMGKIKLIADDSEPLERGRIEITERYNRDRWDGLGPIGPECAEAFTEFGSGGLAGSGKNDLSKRLCGSYAQLKGEKEQQEKKNSYGLHSSFSSSDSSSGSSCVIFSIGGNDEWSFEQEIVTKLGCTTHTFDCTLKDGIARKKPDDERIHFHNICAGDSNYELGKMKFRTYQELLKIAGVMSPPTLLKMDIEGFEFDVLTAMLNAGSTTIAEEQQLMLPQQIAVELHYQTWMIGLDWTLRNKQRAELALIGGMLFNGGGYMLLDVNHESNNCIHCAEVLYGKVLC
jgi:hypothetical protein